MRIVTLISAALVVALVSAVPSQKKAAPAATAANPAAPATTAVNPGAADLIVDLPGLPAELEGQLLQYSGYLNGGEGRMLHYWFVESQNSPSDDPLFLWLNGGPGCSSLDGFLAEHGPFAVNDDLSLRTNPYSWTTFANIIYLESPACVGFSYSETDNCASDDDFTSEQNYNALKDFFEKFPSYRDHEFFITGESYAGIYVPTLADRIVANNLVYNINLAGFAIGNGLLSYKTNDNSVMFYKNYHALLGQSLWDDLIENCCTDGVLSEKSCEFYDSTAACSTLKVKAYAKTSGLNIYNLYGDCEESELGYSTPMQKAAENLFMQPGLKKSDPQARLTPPCINVDSETLWLNTPEVREAIHIPDHVQDWEICSDIVNRRYTRTYDDITPQILRLKEAGIRGLIFNGDFDMACNYLGNQWFVEALGYNVTAQHRPWTVRSQVAGTVKQWSLLDMVTVKGAGHMVPEDKPVQALKMIMSFVYGTDY